MVAIDRRIQQWANIKNGERFVIENDAVVVKDKSQVTFWQRLTGKARLSHAFAAMIAKVEKERQTIESSTDYAVKTNLATLRGRVKQIADKYNDAHGSLYLWFFGKDVKTKSETLIQKIDERLGGMASGTLSPDASPSSQEVIDDSVFITVEAPTTFQASQRNEEKLVELATWLTDHIAQHGQSEYLRKERKFRELAKTNPPPENFRINLHVFKEAGGYTHFFSGASDDIKNKWVVHLFNTAANNEVEYLEDFAVHTLEDLVTRENVAGKKEAMDAILAFATRDLILSYVRPRRYVQLCGSIARIEGAIAQFITERVSAERLCKFLRLFIQSNTDLPSEIRHQSQAIVCDHMPAILEYRELVLQLLDLPGVNDRDLHEFNIRYIVPALFGSREQAERYLNFILEGASEQHFDLTEAAALAFNRELNEDAFAFLLDRAREQGCYEVVLSRILRDLNHADLRAYSASKKAERFLKNLDLSDFDCNASMSIGLHLKLAIIAKRLGETVSANYAVLKRHLWERTRTFNASEPFDQELAAYIKEEPTAWGRWCMDMRAFHDLLENLPEEELLEKVAEFVAVPNRSLATTFEVWLKILLSTRNGKLIETLNDEQFDALTTNPSYYYLPQMHSIVKYMDPSRDKQKEFLRRVVQIPGYITIDDLNDAQREAVGDLISDSAD